MKQDWKKQEKELYNPSDKPSIVQVPSFSCFAIQGQGNPNGADFAKRIEVLYNLSYAVKMSIKKPQPKELQINGYFDYAIYPLEGIWTLSETGQKTQQNSQSLDKDQLAYTILIRQPAFLQAETAKNFIQSTALKKGNPLIKEAQFITLDSYKAVHILHKGSYDEEPKSFALLQAFCQEHNLIRKTMDHTEIYLSNALKTAPEKLRTILRYSVQDS